MTQSKDCSERSRHQMQLIAAEPESAHKPLAALPRSKATKGVQL